MEFKDKVAIITGSARGIGYSIADQFAEKGAIVVVSDLSQDDCDSAAKKIAEAHDAKTIGIKADVANADEVQQLVKKTIEAFGKVDILINNAGITKDGLLMRMSEDDWKKVLDINLNSVFYCTKAVIRPMLKQKYGRIVNVASVVGVIGNPGQANYAASKAGIIGFTKSIAKEVSAKGITCNAVAPGFIKTDMTSSLPEEYLDNIIKWVPQKRLGSPQDVANLVLFLASDLSAYITGQTISVDGGMSMQ